MTYNEYELDDLDDELVYPYSNAPAPKDRAVRRKLLREALVKVAKNRCEWAECNNIGTDMAHITASGMGGAISKDRLDNVALLCHHHHMCFDYQMSAKQRQFALSELLRGYVLGNR